MNLRCYRGALLVRARAHLRQQRDHSFSTRETTAHTCALPRDSRKRETNGDRFTCRADEEIGATSFASPQRRSTCSQHSSEEEKGAVAESPAHPADSCPPHRAPGRNRAPVAKHRERGGC